MNRALMEDLNVPIREIVEKLGYECVRVMFTTEASRQKLQIFIDTIGGIDLSDCERVSKAVNSFLDSHESLELSNSYFLEVSSPGVERPLISPENYRRFRGKEVKVRLKEPLDGVKVFNGVIEVSDDTSVSFSTEKGEMTLLFEQIEEAFLVFRGLEVQSPAKKGQKKKNKETSNEKKHGKKQVRDAHEEEH